MEAVREYALNYAKSLPDYRCAQTTRRTNWAQGEVIDAEIVFADNIWDRRLLRINGQPVSPAIEAQLSGPIAWGGDYGEMLGIISIVRQVASFDGIAWRS